MILTLTANPSIDRTTTVDGRVERGGVYRLALQSDVPGGKGVNVSAAVHHAGRRTLALYPAAETGRFSRLLGETPIPHEAIDIRDEARVNLTIVESDGTTTKLNTPGAPLLTEDVDRILGRLAHHAPDASWVVLAGSLPPNAPVDFWVTCLRTVREANPDAGVAVDTSDAALRAVGDALPGDAPEVMKPNGHELGQLVGVDGREFEDRAAAGDVSGVVAAARRLNALGVGEVLVTLGPAGAVLVLDDAPALVAAPPPTVPLSTVGAGDSALAGYLLAREEGLDAAGALARAVAYGSAAAALPGTTIPRPDQTRPELVEVREI
ncbi:1-phosphofructokinase family hexose kinase [uncultured Corynebacterium sp.]|uniref:1-phosphofructokinase family hexose kinase n=1 Tax=uncultured Corynebacterium sp. TaxID=159447 RepID=UPI0025DC4C50|nr:1-phosphofructokinase family hexose kinase [uncultured Corynebacterium sp.]